MQLSKEKPKANLTEVNVDTMPNLLKLPGGEKTVKFYLQQKFDTRLNDMIERYKELPAIVVAYGKHSPLLLEARELFIEGKFYSCIAMSGISAERIAKEIFKKNIKIKHNKKTWNAPSEEQAEILDNIDMNTLRKLLIKSAIIDNSLNTPFQKLAELRNKYVHASQTISKKDAKAAIDYLHQIIEGTVSVIGKYRTSDSGGVFVK